MRSSSRAPAPEPGIVGRVEEQIGAIVAVDDSLDLNPNGVKTIDVLANDIGPGNSGLVITHINGVAVSAGSTVTLPSGQQVTVNADGTFTYDPNGQPTYLDYDAAGMNFHKAQTRKKEVSPLFIAKYIRQELQLACDIVRPPLHLQGDDLLTDGAGRIFTSEDTLLANGGNVEMVKAVCL